MIAAETRPGGDLCDVVDADDKVIAVAPRNRCHGNPALIHRAAHVLVLNGTGQVLLQKRAASKQIQPGGWDSSVGGHVDAGETYRQAAAREMEEELGLCAVPMTFLFHSRIRNEIESENVATYLVHHEGPFRFCTREIDEVRFWRPCEIEESFGTGVLTPNFEDEWRLFQDWRGRCQGSRGGPGLCGGDAFPDLVAALQSARLP